MFPRINQGRAKVVWSMFLVNAEAIIKYYLTLYG